jgi:hypothetical protein
MSRLPIMDIYLVPVGSGGSDNSEEDKMEFDFADTRENPEENVLRREGELTAAGFVDDFLNNLNKSVRGKTKQYNRMINVLWYCYLISDSGTQLESPKCSACPIRSFPTTASALKQTCSSFLLTASTKPDNLKKPCAAPSARLSRLKK